MTFTIRSLLLLSLVGIAALTLLRPAGEDYLTQTEKIKLIMTNIATKHEHGCIVYVFRAACTQLVTAWLLVYVTAAVGQLCYLWVPKLHGCWLLKLCKQ